MKGTEMTVPLSDGDIEALFMTYMKEDNLASAIVFARAIEAAWTRKPAEQMAGVEPVAYIVDYADIGEGKGRSLFYEGEVKANMENACSYSNNMCARPTTVTPLHTHPAPEPVSVPVKWEDRLHVMTEEYPDVVKMSVEVAIKTAKNAELADWRALAAERGWVK